MTDLEIEVKFYIADPQTIRQQLDALGAVFTDRCTENNIRFEDAGRSLIEKNALLRLRQTDTACILTYKGEPPDTSEAPAGFKTYREWEVTVDDFDAMYRILGAIGFAPAQRYEKIRETYVLAGATVCIDHMPYGDFLEIEGPPGAIRRMAKQLGLDWHERILENYLAIFDRLKAECHLNFRDVTFENFKDVELDFSRYAARFTAGGGT
ncbi:MAG: class IV adenylate cyclase [Thermodesulfobacteriota bacterium]